MRPRLKFLGSLLWPVIALLPAAAVADQCSELDGLVSQAEQLRELQSVGAVKCAEIAPADFSTAQRLSFERTGAGRALLYEERIFKALGFIEPGFPYSACSRREYSESAAPFYDGHLKTIFLPRGRRVSKALIVHELVHALQDKHFGEWAPARSTDEALARMALREGDATAVQIRYQDQYGAEVTSETDESPAGAVPGCEFPELIREIFSFPYRFGLVFVNRLLGEGGYAAVNRAYRSPPKTTCEIMSSGCPESVGQAEKWFADTQEALLLGFTEGRVEYRDSFGQFLTGRLLKLTVPLEKSHQVSRNLRGDQVRLIAAREGRFLSWQTRWASAAASQEFGSILARHFEQLQGRRVPFTGRGVVVDGPRVERLVLWQSGRLVILGVELAGEGKE